MSRIAELAADYNNARHESLVRGGLNGAESSRSVFAFLRSNIPVEESEFDGIVISSIIHPYLLPAASDRTRQRLDHSDHVSTTGAARGLAIIPARGFSLRQVSGGSRGRGRAFDNFPVE